jgi:hypothetical protein
MIAKTITRPAMTNPAVIWVIGFLSSMIFNIRSKIACLY